MAKNQVLLVHGMGKHPAGWSQGWQQKITELARAFAPYSKGRALTEDLEFVEIRYDGVFDEDVDANGNKKPGYRMRWNNLTAALADTAMPAVMRGALQAISSNDQKQSAAVTWFWERLLDPLLWFGIDQAREAVIATVAAQFAAAVARATANSARVHILAHSLGTSVVHDTLVCLLDPKYTKDRFDPLLGGYRWDSLTMVANVSRLLQATRSPSTILPIEAFDPLQSRVRPGKQGLVRDMVNVRHEWDPFTFVRTFHDQLVRPGFVAPPPLTRFAAAMNIHDLETQIAKPDVTAFLLRTWLGKGELGTDAEIKAAMPAYEKAFPLSTELFKSIVRGDGSLDLEALAKLLAAIAKAMREENGGQP